MSPSYIESREVIPCYTHGCRYEGHVGLTIVSPGSIRAVPSSSSSKSNLTEMTGRVF